jgi:23S rRNA pseudouridine2605 synthase
MENRLSGLPQPAWKRGSSLTLEQLEVARAERMRQNGHGVLTLEEARTWIEETGLCLFLPKRQFSASLAPSFVEAVAGQRNVSPDSRQIAAAEELLVRLELDGIVVRLNLLGQPGEQPDYVVAAWVLPYVYALRGDRDWRRVPQLTGSRQVSPLAIQAYKQLETGDMPIAELKQNLGHGVSEMAVLRAITELWQQLRIIPVVAAPGKAAKWQLLRHRFQKAIAEGASTSQVTAISVLASIYLQAVIAASMEDVEIFLSPLTARSKIREVIRGLVATRQVHTLSLGHAPHFYVAGTLPEFAPAVSTYASSIGSSYLPYQEESAPEPAPVPVAPRVEEVPPAPEVHAHANGSPRHANRPASRPAGNGKPSAPRPHFSRTAARDRKPAQSASSTRTGRTSTSRSGSSRTAGARWAANGAKSAHSNGSSRNGNGNHASAKAGSERHSRPAGARSANGARPAGARPGKPASRNVSLSRASASTRRTSDRKPALTAGSASNGSKRFGFSAKNGSKKRG